MMTGHRGMRSGSSTYRSCRTCPASGPCPARRSAREVARHGGRVLALGRFRESAAGDITPRQVLILVEWESRAAFESYRQDPALANLHPHREAGTSAYVWHLFDRLDDLRPLLRP